MGTTRSAINMTVSGSLPVDSAEKGLILSPLTILGRLQLLSSQPLGS